jgi:2-iminobutanoate/2-iminopropanoate deaminase|tara:strand:+ start:23073 stop:23435 length:363 start_codon:yes stop_codon:yes gene_type:complete
MSKLKSPKPVGPYSMFRDLSSGGWISSGQIPIDPETGKLNNDTIEEEVIQVFNNLEAVLSDNGKSINDVKKFLVFLTDLSVTPLVNAEIEKRLTEPFPARSTIQVVGLPMGANVEVECLG